MRKSICFTVFLLYFLCGNGWVIFAKEVESIAETRIQSKTEKYIQWVYNRIHFNKNARLSYQAFKAGFYGYMNLIEAGKLEPGSLLTICDFTLSSNAKRMWVIDPKTGKINFNTLVAHGMGSGDEFATSFSNTPESHQSSLGFYITGETYTGNNGYSLKLDGVDGSFNSNANERAIVIHGAPYVCTQFACDNKRIGRSYGCPALPLDIAPRVIDQIKNGSCLFIYYPSKEYLSSSYWLRSKITQLPQDAEQMMLASTLSTTVCDDDCAINPMASQTNSNGKSSNKLPIQKGARKNEDTVIKPTELSETARKNITSIIVIKERGNALVSDTTYIK